MQMTGNVNTQRDEADNRQKHAETGHHEDEADEVNREISCGVCSGGGGIIIDALIARSNDSRTDEQRRTRAHTTTTLFRLDSSL